MYVFAERGGATHQSPMGNRHQKSGKHRQGGDDKGQRSPGGWSSQSSDPPGDANDDEPIPVTHDEVVVEEERVGMYVLGRELGHGTQGVCRIGHHEERPDEEYAVKVMTKKTQLRRSRSQEGKFGKARGQAAREVAIMRKLNHPNLSRLVDVLDDPDENKFYIVMELLRGGEMMSDRGRSEDKLVDEATARKYFGQLVFALEYLHHQQIIHRDIKPSNCLLDEHGSVKLRYDWLVDVCPWRGQAKQRSGGGGTEGPEPGERGAGARGIGPGRGGTCGARGKCCPRLVRVHLAILQLPRKAMGWSIFEVRVD